jgi:predicted amidohydrolase YtcJ
LKPVLPNAVELILSNGVIYTVDPADQVAEAVAIANGRIVAVGQSDEILALAGPGTRTVDLKGRAVVPGFVDAHPHLDTVGLRLTRPVFGEPDSIDAVLEVIRQEVARRQPGEWIICNPLANEPDVFSYPQRLREGRWPTRYDLDRVSPDNPVYIEPPQLVAPGHAFANSAALKAAGITGATTAPPGVEILLDDAGEPTGVFRDVTFPKTMPVVDGAFRAATSLFPTMPELTQADTYRAVAAGVKAFNAAGITAIYEGHGIPAGPQRAFLDLWHEGQLTLRTYFVISYPISYYHDRAKGKDLIEHTARYASGKGFGDDYLKFGGLGFSFDSAAAMGACLMRRPYVGATGQEWTGVQLPSDEAFKEIVFDSARAGLRVQVQCSGGAAIDKVLSLYQQVDREIPIEGKRWTIQHCQFPSQDNVETCCELGVIPTTTTNFLLNYGSVYERAFGPELAQEAIPFKKWIDAGVPVAQCTDGRPYEPMVAFWGMLSRQDAVSGKAFGPGQKLSRADALRAYTLNGARAAFWEHATGSIEPGKFADMVILSDDIMTIPEERIPDTKVLATLVGGKAVHDTGLLS